MQDAFGGLSDCASGIRLIKFAIDEIVNDFDRLW